ncbi:GCN5-like N-acetyltransferase [Dendryphion nanum]|uniref:GCN5-like N-acetyltransferase n=1 Tax=Dendryphion nanum TaxID=256645 RepID=A0A9P9D713_9PLEO|nr:GCN5-like N-acetyltransferase [Dendryphion nanum]
MSISIRAIEPGDKEAWLNLWEQYNEFCKRPLAQEITEITFSRIIDDSIRIYGAVAEDVNSHQIIGFVHWIPWLSTSSAKERVIIADLLVDKDMRGKGAGRLLVEHVFEYAKSISSTLVQWNAHHWNHQAHLLYDKVAEKTEYIVYRKAL